LCRSSGKRLLPPSKEVHHVRPSGLGLGGWGWLLISGHAWILLQCPFASWHIHMLRHHLLFFGSVSYHQSVLSVGSAEGSCATDSFVDMDARRHAIHLGRQPVCRLFEASRTGERWHALPTSVARWLILLPAWPMCHATVAVSPRNWLSIIQVWDATDSTSRMVVWCGFLSGIWQNPIPTFSVVLALGFMWIFLLL
jgi:hypothetical protein